MEINTNPPMMQVVSAEHFQKTISDISKKLEEIESELTLCRELLPGLTWMNRTQSMKFLCCSSTKLWELQKSKKITISSVGTKTLYKTESLRKYLQSKSTDNQEINERLKNIFT